MRRKKLYGEEPPVVIDGRRTNNYICFVDGWRRPSRRRNTYGQYRVGAKNPKQAKKLLQNAVGFGSVQVRFLDNGTSASDLVPLGECVHETYDETTGRYRQEPVRHAGDPVN